MVQRDPEVQLHLLQLYSDEDPGLWNFSRAAELMAAGRHIATEYLQSREPSAASPAA